MEPNGPGNESNLNPENPPVPSGNKWNQLLKSKFYILFIVIALVVVLFPVLFFSTYLVKNNSKVAPSPTRQAPSPVEDTKPSLQPFPSKGDYVENQLIIEYKEGMSPEELLDNDQRSQLAADLQRLGVILQEKLHESTDTNLKNFYVLTFKEGIDVEKVSTEIYKIPQIKGVEPNGKVEIFK